MRTSIAAALKLSTLSTLFALSTLVGFGAQAQTLDRGWWVVVGSYGEMSPQEMNRTQAQMQARLKPCGVEAFSDYSSKFSGFRPGLMVYVLGAYRTRGAAELARARVAPCAPEAYLKSARYAGE